MFSGYIYIYVYFYRFYMVLTHYSTKHKIMKNAEHQTNFIITRHALSLATRYEVSQYFWPRHLTGLSLKNKTIILFDSSDLDTPSTLKLKSNCLFWMFQYADLSKMKSTPTVREQVSLNFFIDIRYPILQRQRGASSGFCISSYHQLLCGVLFVMFLCIYIPC